MTTITFRPGDAVEYTSYFDSKAGCIVTPGKKPVIRGTYVKAVGDAYSDVQVGRGKPLLVLTSRLRHAGSRISPPEAA